jgi:ribose transport system substrate-binding protein
MIRSAIFGCIVFLSLMIAGCGGGVSVETPKPTNVNVGGSKPKSITIGMCAKANSNQVFQVARTAGTKTCEDLSKSEGIPIKLEWRTPDQEDPAQQARNIESLATICQGISVACSEGETLVGPINAAIGKGVNVMCFDSDSPNSKRLCYFGTDDTDLGKQLVGELIKVMGDKGVVGILAGNQNAPNLQKRVNACREALKAYPNIKLAGPTQGAFYHEETGQGAAAAWAQAQTANPEITGWVLVGGWPLFTQGATKALGEPGKVKVVSCDALPEQLSYVRDGSVQVLLSQDLYGWGEQSVKILVDKILHDKYPPPNVYGKLTRVTKENVEEFAKNWDVWAPNGK